MAVTSISVILTVAVLKLHHCGPKQRPVPEWVRTFVLYRLARLLGCKCDTTCCYSDRKRKPKRPRNENADVCLRLMNESRTSPVAELRSVRQKNAEIPNGDAMKRIGLLEDILKYLQILVAKRDEDDEEEELINEWQAVAHICDKLLFILFLTCTILVTLLLMIFIPLMQNIKNRRPDDLYL
ncbi:unnamed protein product [Dimorphilus gyrociliatus]|uniref:Neurotransmitter-gated ion-channel transmembrane domain-containing protein n=1 Tax=Dimorphilus gyrociliatus TaxID=2664684 RepID=A0A7I8WCB0_9ANNE|nr:unnamed protein product [Dimorphilus gyrociliatus]